MLKPTVKRGLMLDFIPNEIICPVSVNYDRIFKLNNNKIGDGDIIYIASRELRLEDNWGVIFASELAQKHDKKLKILIKLPEYSKQQKAFLNKGLNFFKKNLALYNIDFAMYKAFPENAGAIILDFNPINSDFDYAGFKHAIFEVDSHNIIPARFISDKQEYSAATLRRKIYANIAGFLTEYPNNFKTPQWKAQEKLNDFVKNKLDYYAVFKNDYNKDVTSNLSPYMHFGFISSQRIALEIIKSTASRENKEAFLEELIVRKELSDNFCLYNRDYKYLDACPLWAKESLNEHRTDIRSYVYSLNEFEHAKTHDKNWNKIQENLLNAGRIHGYLRMYWGKKILEWSKSPEEALEIAIYLNDKYALDGNEPNGYVGILWSIGGLHDRPFANRMVTGKIRYMNLKTIYGI